MGGEGSVCVRAGGTRGWSEWRQTQQYEPDKHGKNGCDQSQILIQNPLHTHKFQQTLTPPPPPPPLSLSSSLSLSLCLPLSHCHVMP